MTNSNCRNVKQRIKAVIFRKLCGLDSYHEPSVNCLKNHRTVARRGRKTMSVGCFGEGCSFSSNDEGRSRISKVHCKFYPPIQTILKEKDTEKW